MKAIVCLSLFALLSVTWSQDPGTSLRRSLFLVLGTAFAFYLVRRFSAEALAQIVVVTGVIAGLIGILVSVGLPSYGQDSFNDGAWQGIFRSKNGCGQIMLFFFSAAACFRFSTPRMRKIRWLLYPIAGLLVVMSKAATAYMIAPGIVLLVAFLSSLRRFERRNALFLIVGAFILLIAGAVAISYSMPYFLGLLGKDPEMSGRLPLWTAVIASAVQRPMLGYGYAAFWTGMHGESLNVFMTTHFEIHQAQNGLLETWVELGAVGVVLVLATFVRATRDALTCLQHGYSPVTNWYITIIAMTVVYNLDETFLVTAHSLPWLLYIVACTGLADRARQLRSASTKRANPASRIFVPRPLPSVPIGLPAAI